MSRIDENNGYVAMGYNPQTGLAQPLRVDPTTGELLIKVIAAFKPVFADPRFRIDQNNEHTSTAWDDTNSEIKPLKTRSTVQGDALIITF